MIVGGVVNGVGYLSNTISEALDKAKKERRQKGYDIHHIVAKKDERAELSREILESCKIAINSPYNLVKVSKTLHWYLHTSGYHAAVSMLLVLVFIREIPLWNRNIQLLLDLYL